ncbi:MAG: hypothetical protein HRF44_04480 [Ignavibacterium sp.]
MLTTLAIVFVILLLGSILYGFGIIMRRPPTSNELHTERCSLCKQRFDKKALVERESGDTRVFYFCHDCINRLSADSSAQRLKNEISS